MKYKNCWMLFLCLICICLNLGAVSQVQAAQVYAQADVEFLPEYIVKRYEDIKQDTLDFMNIQRCSATGLVESYQGSSKYYFIPGQEEYFAGKGGYLENQTFTYDLATSAMVYTICGEDKRARAILGVMAREFYRDKNGYIGLYTSYLADSFDVDGKTPFMGCDGDRIHVGPNMWIALACLQYLRITNDTRYLGFVIDMAQWASKLPHYQFPDGEKGGVSMGSGWGPDWSKVYSTENCIDYYSILNILLRIYEQGSSKVKVFFTERDFTDKEIKQEMKGLERWFKEVAFNKETCGFNSGYNEDGLDTTKALDTISNSIQVIGPERLKRWGIDPFRLMEFAERYLLVKDTVKGKEVEGFDFTVPEEIGNSRKRLIWIEGTAQMILAYKIMSKYSAAIGQPGKAGEYKNKAIKYTKELDKIAELINLPHKVLPYTSACPQDKEKLITYKWEWEIPRGPQGQCVGSIASAAWRFIALTYFNPMMLGRLKFSL